MRRVLVDSAVVIYATGAEHPLRQPCKSVLEMPSLEICASVEMIQEFVFHGMRVGDTGLAVELAQGWAQACKLYAFDPRRS